MLIVHLRLLLSIVIIIKEKLSTSNEIVIIHGTYVCLNIYINFMIYHTIKVLIFIGTLSQK